MKIRSLFFAALLTLGSGPAELWCEPACLRSPDDDGSDAFGYRQLDGRCEGRYARPISGVERLTLVSFTRLFQPYSFFPGAALELTWEVSDETATTLIARALEPGEFYQMDTALEAGTGQFTWPLRYLSGIDIAPADLGVVAYYTSALAGRDRRVHIPLTLRQPGAGAASPQLRVLLSAEVSLSRVHRTLKRLGDDGAVAAIIVDQMAVQEPDFPANWSFPVEVSEAYEPGVYCLSVSASVLNSNTTLAEDFYFRLAPADTVDLETEASE